MKKKKKKAAATPKKAAKRGASGALKKVKKAAASKPKKQKKQTKPAPAKKGKKMGPPPCPNPLYPDMCSQNFTASNGQCVQFQNLPALQCTITEDSGVPFPFTPYSTHPNGVKYVTISSGDWLTISVPAINQTYPYAVDCCNRDNPAHSVTVDS